MKKQFNGILAILGVALLLGLAGCGDTAPEIGRDILSFSIDGRTATINQATERISVQLLGDDEDLTALTPEITVSRGATVEPASGEEVDLSVPKYYTVTAENGGTRTYIVSVTTLNSIDHLEIVAASIPQCNIGAAFTTLTGFTVYAVNFLSGENTQRTTVNSSSYTYSGFDSSTAGNKTMTIAYGGKTATLSYRVVDQYSHVESVTIKNKPAVIAKMEYEYGEFFEIAGLEVEATYSDGSTTKHAPGYFNGMTLSMYQGTNLISGSNISSISNSNVVLTTVGDITVYVTVGGQTDSFTITVKRVNVPLELEVKLLNNNEEVVFYGLPESGDVVLSWLGERDPDANFVQYPTRIIVSATGYTDPTWYVDNGKNAAYTAGPGVSILTLDAENYTLSRPHTVVFTGYKSVAKNSGTESVYYSASFQFTVKK